MSRFSPQRLLTIGVWASAAAAWVMALLGEPQVQAPSVVPPPPTPTTSVPATTPGAAMPVPPEQGLTILRFTPVAPPPPEVIVRTVASVSAQSTSAAKVVTTSQGS